MAENPLQQHVRAVGDIRTPFAFKLKQSGSAVDLDGLTVQFKMENNSGTDIVSWTATGVTVTDATAGEGYFAFQATHVATAGDYWVWVRCGVSPSWDTFPCDGKKMKVTLVAAEV